MGPWSVVLLVVGILGAQAILWIVVLRWLRGRLRETLAGLERELSAAGEFVRRAPEAAVYRGGSGDFSRVKGNGAIALTDQRLVFVKLVGARFEVPIAEIAQVREEKWFRRSAVGRQTHVVIETRKGDEIGFFVKDRPAWSAALREGRSPGSP